MKIQRRPSIWIGQGGLIAIAVLGMVWGYKELALAAVVAIASTLHKVVDADDKKD